MRLASHPNIEATREVALAVLALQSDVPRDDGERDAEGESLSLLERLLQEVRPEVGRKVRQEPHPPDLLRILQTESREDLLRALFSDRTSTLTTRDAARQLDCAVAQIEALLEAQVNAILHHPRFQRLEAAWRGVEYVTQQAAKESEYAEELGEDAKIIVRMFSASKKELLDDAGSAVEFDQSVLFKVVYEAEFGTAGGTPFGLLIGDYEFRNHPDDIDLLRSFGQVAAAAFAPLVTAASPQLFQLDDFQRLEIGLSLDKDFQQADYAKWRALRDREDMRFVGLTLPHILMRLPYEPETSREQFRFRERVEGRDRRKYLWGNSAYALVSVVLRAYVESGWFADIRGFERGHETGGLVTGLPTHSFSTDRQGIARKTSTDMVITSTQERELSNLGFIPLCPCPGTEHSVFFSNQSLHKPKVFADAATTTTSRMSSMLQYMLCASRFAHYLKVLAREKIGSVQSAEELATYLSRWISRYITDDPTAKNEMKAKYPLRRAEIQIEQIPGQSGAYRMQLQLLPHYQLDELSASLHLVHRLTGGPRT